jgi:hypothetical protein
MSKPRISRWYLLLGLPALLALVGLVWGRPGQQTVSPNPAGGGWHAPFHISDLHGRYNSAETGYDVSSVHTGYDGNVGPPIFFSATNVMEADGKGHVCGSADGFYGGFPPPGVNFGESYYYGTYTIDSNGRITITTCPDTGFCAHSGACAASAVTTVQVGYLQSCNGNRVTTAEQQFSTGAGAFSSGFLVHSHVWERDPADENPY